MKTLLIVLVVFLLVAIVLAKPSYKSDHSVSSQEIINLKVKSEGSKILIIVKQRKTYKNLLAELQVMENISANIRNKAMENIPTPPEAPPTPSQQPPTPPHVP